MIGSRVYLPQVQRFGTVTARRLWGSGALGEWHVNTDDGRSYLVQGHQIFDPNNIAVLPVRDLRHLRMAGG